MIDFSIAGDYVGSLHAHGKKHKISIKWEDGFLIKKKREAIISKETVESYEVINSVSTKDMGSGVTKGLLGGAVFGIAGALAGASSAKTNIEYTVSINFKDGKRCLCKLNDGLYNYLIAILF